MYSTKSFSVQFKEEKTQEGEEAQFQKQTQASAARSRRGTAASDPQHRLDKHSERTPQFFTNQRASSPRLRR